VTSPDGTGRPVTRHKAPVDQPPEESPPSLNEERQQLTRSRIRRAAMEVVARRGFDATVEEIAQLSGVSPRTIFRHYLSHDRLIVATVKDMYEASGRRPIEGLPTPTEDLDGWLEGLALTIHTRNAEIIGDAFWDMHAPNPDATEILSEVPVLRRDYRVRGVHYLVALAWRTAGGTGDPPEALTLAFALNFSAFATHALMIDFDQTPAQVGELTADVLKLALTRALQDQRSTERSGATDMELGDR
jgi:AcrR family transcriptional regulator